VEHITPVPGQPQALFVLLAQLENIPTLELHLVQHALQVHIHHHQAPRVPVVLVDIITPVLGQLQSLLVTLTLVLLESILALGLHLVPVVLAVGMKHQRLPPHVHTVLVDNIAAAPGPLRVHHAQ